MPKSKNRIRFLALVALSWAAAYMIFYAARSVNSADGEVLAVACGFIFQFAAGIVFQISRTRTELEGIRAALEAQNATNSRS